MWWRACLIWRHKAVYWTGPILVVLTLGMCHLSPFSSLGLLNDSTLPLGLAAIGVSLNHPGTLMSIYFIFGADRFSTAGAALSLATNLAATTLIAYKAWWVSSLLPSPDDEFMAMWRAHRSHRRRLRRYLGADNAQTRVLKVLVLLVESGSVYSIILVSGTPNTFVRRNELLTHSQILVVVLQPQKQATNSDPGIYFLYGCLAPLVVTIHTTR